MDRTQLLDMLISAQEAGVSVNAAQMHSLNTMKKCRTHEMGGRILVCPECGTQTVQYNPCNVRGCPICYRKNQLQWQDKAQKHILPTKHFHLIFSIPTRYTKLWLSNKSLVIESLFQAVRLAIHDMGESEGLLLGSLLVFQSHGVGMSYKPHMHCALSGGGLDAAGIYREIRAIRFHELEAIVENEFEKRIKSIPGIEHEVPFIVKERSTYKVYTKIHEENGDQIIEYLAGSKNGVVLDIEDEVEVENGQITITEPDHDTKRITHLDATTFIERYLNHIPPERTIMARYYGLYSNRHREDYKRARKQVKKVRINQEVKRYKELCPVCKAETKVAFLFSYKEICLIPGLSRMNAPPKHGEIVNVAQ